MKKAIVLLLSLLVVFALAACGDSSTDTQTDTSTNTDTQTDTSTSGGNNDTDGHIQDVAAGDELQIRLSDGTINAKTISKNRLESYYDKETNDL